MQNNKRYWFWGGVISLILYISTWIISYLLYAFCFNTSGNFWECVDYLMVSLIPLGLFGDFIDFLERSPSSGLLNWIPVINGMMWIFIGIFLGWLYGKIKNRNKNH